MAKPVYSSEIIGLQDGTEIKLIPLAIGRLRKFMDAWGRFATVSGEDNYAAFDIYIQCCGIALSRELSAAKGFENPVSLDGELSEEYKDYLEDTLDIDTIFKIVEVCGGIDLKDPKLMETAERILSDGQN